MTTVQTFQILPHLVCINIRPYIKKRMTRLPLLPKITPTIIQPIKLFLRLHFHD